MPGAIVEGELAGITRFCGKSWKEPTLLCGAGSVGVGYVMLVGLGSGYFADAGWV